MFEQGKRSCSKLSRLLDWLRLYSYYTGYLFVPTRESIRYSMKKGTELSNILTIKAAGREALMNLIPSPHFLISTSVSVDSSPRSYSFTSATVRIPVHTTLSKVWHRTYPICKASRSRSARQSFAPLRITNRTEITVLMCKQEPYPLWFSCRRKSDPV